MPERNSDFAHQIQRIWPGLSSQLAKKIGPIKDDLFLEMQNIGLVPKTDQSSNPLDYWSQGYVPSDIRIADFLTDVGVRRAKLDSEWLIKFLRAAGYREAVIAERVRSYWPPTEASLPPLRMFTLEERGERFLGRQTDMEAVLEALRSSWPVLLIQGLPGAGKTTLAREVAYACAGQPRAETRDLIWPYFAFIVWTTAVGRKLTLSELLDEIAHRLGYPGISQKPLEYKRPALVDLLAHLVEQRQPVLIVVDNFEDIADPALADFVTHVPAGVKVMLTSREDVRQLHTIFHRFPPALIPLGGLPDEDALSFVRFEAERRAALLRQPKEIPKRDRLTAVITTERETLIPLVKATEGNPKALELALGYIADNAIPLPTLVRNLYAATDSVEGLFNYFFRQAWEKCDEGARALWRVLPFFATTARGEALAATAGLSGRSFQAALSELQGRSLLDIEEGPENATRYRTHPLVRGFANFKLRDNTEFEKTARERWCDYFLQFASYHIVRDKPKDRYWNALLGRNLTDIDADKLTLLEVLAWVDKTGQAKRLVELMIVLAHYLGSRAYEQRIDFGLKAAEAARKLGQVLDEAFFRIDTLGWSLIAAGRFEEAEQELAKGIAITAALDDQQIKNDLTALWCAFQARVYLAQGLTEKAAACIEQARGLTFQSVIAYRLNMVAGDVAERQGSCLAAIAYLEQALKDQADYGGERPNVGAQSRLSKLYRKAGRLQEAKAILMPIFNPSQHASSVSE